MSKNNETYNVGLIWPGDEHSVEIMQDAEGNFITDEFLDYILPLVQGEIILPFENGFPKFFKLKK